MNLNIKDVLTVFTSKKPLSIKQILKRMKLHNTKLNFAKISSLLNELVSINKLRKIGKKQFQIKARVNKSKRYSSKQSILNDFAIDESPKSDIDYICKKYKYKRNHSKKGKQQALHTQTDNQKLIEKSLCNRKDYTKYNVVTIDGEDAKDYDDAVHVERKNNTYILQVHIADVSHYIPEESPLDKEAYKRATSVYLIDKVIPMFPFEISNDVCSLKAKQRRLSLSVDIILNGKAEIISYTFHLGVIKVARRFTYNEVQKIIDNPELYRDQEAYKNHVNHINLMNELAKKLFNKRTRNGSIDFNIPEMEIKCDEQSFPIKISSKDRLQSHRIIEEFMLIANQVAATTLMKSDMPAVYRIHGKPDEEKVENLLLLLNNMGIKFKRTQEITPKMIQEIIQIVSGKKEEALINNKLLRTMQQAIYSTDNIGHFGLAFKNYTHFTSPIRRYPDLIVHRLLKKCLKFSKRASLKMNKSDILKEKAKHCSEKERTAMEAERDITKRKSCHFLNDKIGMIFDGYVSDFTDFGIFVTIKPYGIEALCRFADQSGHYNYDEKNSRVIERKSKKIYNIGDIIKVKVLKVFVNKNIMDLEIIYDEN